MTDYVAGTLIVLGSLVAFIGSVGMLRFRSFYERVHPPTMGSTLGTALILFGSIIYFSVAESRPVLHEVLILLLMTVSTPVTYLLLVRAAIHRGRHTVPDPDER
jgi:multicomponent K+:H+ antiporter subunit G